jgi:hypothetical protein
MEDRGSGSVPIYGIIPQRRMYISSLGCLYEKDIFASNLFTLFFERVHATRPVVPCFPVRPMLDARMHMWGYLMPKKC